MEQIHRSSEEVNSRSLDEYIGIVVPLESPYNLFFNGEQLRNQDKPYIYFFVYTLGAKRIAIWGVYERSTGQFIIEDSCRYRTFQLYEMYRRWKDLGFEFSADIVTFRNYYRMDKEPGRVQSYADYWKYGYYFDYIFNRISAEEFRNWIPDEFYDNAEDYFRKTYLVSDSELTDYEIYEKYLEYEAEIEQDRLKYRPRFLEDKSLEDYRRLKYLQAYNTGKVTETELIGEFGPRILEDAFQLVEGDEMKKKWKAIEQRLNQRDSLSRGVGSSLNLSTPSQNLNFRDRTEVARLTREFYELIKTGKYENAKLEECPSIRSCDKGGELCNLYFWSEGENLYFRDPEILR